MDALKCECTEEKPCDYCIRFIQEQQDWWAHQNQDDDWINKQLEDNA